MSQRKGKLIKCSEYPTEIKELPTENFMHSKNFKKSIRTFKNAFASFGATYDKLVNRGQL